MTIKTLKGIETENWIKFKILAAKKNISLGVLFKMMLENYSKNDDFVWEKILGGEKILSEKEAEEIEKSVKALRKEKGFRA